MEPTITITEKEYRDLCRTADTLDWLQSRGLCWRGVDSAFPDWRVGDATEWHYPNAGDVRDKVDAHRSILANDKDLARQGLDSE
jgi:hypothetical protein